MACTRGDCICNMTLPDGEGTLLSDWCEDIAGPGAAQNGIKRHRCSAAVCTPLKVTHLYVLQQRTIADIV